MRPDGLITAVWPPRTAGSVPETVASVQEGDAWRSFRWLLGGSAVLYLPRYTCLHGVDVPQVVLAVAWDSASSRMLGNGEKARAAEFRTYCKSSEDPHLARGAQHSTVAIATPRTGAGGHCTPRRSGGLNVTSDDRL